MTASPRFLTAGTSAECAGRDPMPGPGEVSAPETDRADALAVVRAHDRGMVGAATDLRRRAALDILALQTIGEAGERAVERAEELHGCVPFGSVRHEPSGPGSQVPAGSLPPVIARGTADGQDFCHHWLAASQYVRDLRLLQMWRMGVRASWGGGCGPPGEVPGGPDPLI